jgi:hypothetical protein
MMAFALISTLLSAEPTPVLVELFTSEGCSSCPRADEALDALAGEQPVPGVRVVPLAMHVTYWNDLGWADPFSDESFSTRQRGYGEAYTPQMVVGGSHAFPGSRRDALAALREVKPPPQALTLRTSVERDALHVTLQGAHGGEVFVALTEAGLSSHVTAGENAGRTLKLAPLARRLVRLRDTDTVTLTLDPNWKREHLAVVAFVQEPNQGRVLSVATQPVLR